MWRGLNRPSGQCLAFWLIAATAGIDLIWFLQSRLQFDPLNWLVLSGILIPPGIFAGILPAHTRITRSIHYLVYRKRRI